MCAILVVGNVKEEGIDDIAQRCEVVVAGLARDGLKRCRRCGKSCGDFFWCHGGAEEGGVDRCVVRREVKDGVVR